MTSYLGDRLYRAYVGVWSEQNVLQLCLFLIDSLNRQPLWIFLRLFHRFVFKESLLEMAQGYLSMQISLQCNQDVLFMSQACKVLKHTNKDILMSTRNVSAFS